MRPLIDDAGFEDAGMENRPSAARPQQQKPNCVLDLQCTLVTEACPCRCRLNTDPAGLKFPNTICIAAVCDPCAAKIAFCDYRTFTCQML